MKKLNIIKENEALKHELRVMKASQKSVICEAFRNVSKCGTDRYMGSAVTITIRNINKDKNVVVEEVCISDGLSAETIAAIKADLKRSYDLLDIYPHNKI